MITKTSYIESMFEVLVFVYENYWQGNACPQLEQLGRKLSAVGFELDDIRQALHWLADLNIASHQAQLIDISSARSEQHPASIYSLRVYSAAEQDQLGAACLGFIKFLESAGVLSAHMREIVIDRAMAVPASPIALDDLKIIVLMVYWSFVLEPDALVLDELCDDDSRLAH